MKTILSISLLALALAACGGAPAASAPPTQAGQPTDAAPTDAAPTDVAPTDVAPTDAAPTDAAPTDVAPTDVAPTDAAPTDAAQTDGAPPVAGDVATLTLTGGADAGTHVGAAGIDPNCTLGLIGSGAWGVQWSRVDAAAGELSSVQIVSNAPGTETDEDTFFKDTKMLMMITIGELFDGNVYEIEVKTDAADSSGDGTVEVTDTGTSAVIHATGTTADGVGIDTLINCATVLRQ